MLVTFISFLAIREQAFCKRSCNIRFTGVVLYVSLNILLKCLGDTLAFNAISFGVMSSVKFFSIKETASAILNGVSIDLSLMSEYKRDKYVTRSIK